MKKGEGTLVDGVRMNITDEPLYAVWSSMRQRCNNPKCASYPRYGGRGITVCAEWQSGYLPFRRWAMANGYQLGLTLDRINNDSGYCPDNCRWTDRVTQQGNTRKSVKLTYNGITKSASAWSRELGLGRGAVAKRLRIGWTLEQALSHRDKTIKPHQRERVDLLLEPYLDSGLSGSEIARRTGLSVGTVCRRIKEHREMCNGNINQ